MLKKIIGTLACTLEIIIGGLIIIPEDVNFIIINPGFRNTIGIVLLIFGIAGFAIIHIKSNKKINKTNF